MNGLFPLVKDYHKRKMVLSRNQVSYDIDDSKSCSSPTFEAISSSTTAALLLDSTVEANVKLEDVKMSNDPNITM